MRELLSDSLTDPTKAAAQVLRLHYPLPTLLQCLALLAVLSSLLNYITMFVGGSAGNPEIMDQPAFVMFRHPLVVAIAHVAVLMIMGLGTYFGGRAFGGVGSLTSSFLVTVWINFIQLLISFAQFVILTISPLLGSLVVVAGLIWFFWAFTQFIKVLHGFDNGVLVFFGILAMMVACMFVAVFVAAFATLALGLVPQEVLSDL